MKKLSKRFQEIYKGFDRTKTYSVEDALKLVKNTAKAKFDETVEIAMHLNIDPKKSDQHIRGAISMPNGIGKAVRIAVFAKGDKAAEADKALTDNKRIEGDVVGAEDLIAAIEANKIDFDVCIATPDMMGVIGKVAKILGPKGLMPNAKLGTVTTDVAGAIKRIKAGQANYRTDKSGIVHAGIGKASFEADALQNNFVAFIDTVIKARPAGVKGNFVKSITLSSTMGAGVKVGLQQFKEQYKQL